MILLETSILAFAFGQKTYRKTEPKAVDDLRQMIADDWPLAIPGVVLQELLAGVLEESQFSRLQRILAAFPTVTATRETHVSAAKIAVACRRVGVRCSTVECLIAALATDSASLLFTLDRNFSKIAPQCGLRLYEAGMIARLPKPS
jgi:predicted nucleic acid-binding protein